MPRQPNGRPQIYLGADGDYHTYVSVGLKPDGRLDRRHLRGKTMTAVAEKIEALNERLTRGGGTVQKVETVEQWLLHWAEHVVKPKRAWKTWRGYRAIITTHLIPHLGHWRLDGKRRLEPEHVEAMYTKLGETLAPYYVLNIHRCLKKALKDALRRKKTGRNVCDMIDPPASARSRRKVKPLSRDEAQAVIRQALGDEHAVRWLLGIILGVRQGEALGLRWTHVHLDPTADRPAYIELAKQTQRHTWEHGCPDPAGCAADHCRRKPCPQWEHGCGAPEKCSRNRTDKCPARRKRTACPRHPGKLGCPPLCPAGCTGHARTCPDRRGGGLVDVALKTENSERELAVGELLIGLLRELRERQIREFAEAGADWSPKGHVFVRWIVDVGREPRRLDPRQDYDAWVRLLERSGVAHARLHVARHTAGTMMVATGTPIEVVQEILGHASIQTTKVYVEAAEELKRDAVNRVAAALLDGSLLSLLQPGAATTPPQG